MKDILIIASGCFVTAIISSVIGYFKLSRSKSEQLKWFALFCMASLLLIATLNQITK